MIAILILSLIMEVRPSSSWSFFFFLNPFPAFVTPNQAFIRERNFSELWTIFCPGTCQAKIIILEWGTHFFV